MPALFIAASLEPCPSLKAVGHPLLGSLLTSLPALIAQRSRHCGNQRPGALPRGGAGIPWGQALAGTMQAVVFPTLQRRRYGRLGPTGASAYA